MASSSAKSNDPARSFTLDSIKDENERYGYLSTFMVQAPALYDAIERARVRLQTGELDLSEAGFEGQGAELAKAEFLDLFEAELNRVTQTIQSQQEAQELSAKAILANISAAAKAQGVDAVTVTFRAKAADLSDLALKLQRFVGKNAEILTDVATKADAEIGTQTMSFLKRRFSVSPWKEGPNSALVVVLSDIYADIRKLEDKEKQKDSKWVAPSSFERSTTKYWIKEDELTKLLLTAITQAPLLVYGQSGHLTSKADIAKAEGDKLWDSLATPINSVYFDSPTMSLYKERLPRREGAQLFRVRWYGNKPSGDEPVFLELKTHHEKWINEKSVKERVNIREKDMRTFLSSKEWSSEIAEKLVLGAAPTLTGEKLQKQATLITTMHKLVIEKNLRPCVRSMYVRAAFQSPDSNALRLTLDRNVTLIDETRAPRGSWCLPDDAVITGDMVARVPYPVFEIKLSDAEMPVVFQDLMDTGTLIEAPKFSKFLSGAAAFNAHKLDALPYWADHPYFKDMFKAKNKDENAAPPKPTKSGRTLRRVSVAVAADTIGDTNERFERVSEMFVLPDEKEPPTNSKTKSSAPAAVPVAAAATSKSGGGDSGGGGAAAGAAAGFTAGGVLSAVTFGLLGNKEPKVAHKRPARVEPKSYFANERTFIQWISAALLLVTISVILLDFQSGNNVPSTAGIVLNACAVFIVFYSIVGYYRRLKLLQSASPYGYVDHFGPIILAGCVLLGLILLLYYYVSEKNNDTSVDPAVYTGPTVTSQEGFCFQRPTNGISSLDYQPSGVIVDQNQPQLLVPSLDKVTALSTADPQTNVKSLVAIPDADLEALAYVGNRLFAVGEGNINPTLYELDPATYAEIQRWELKVNQNSGSSTQSRTGGAEGLAYIPESDVLFVAGDLFNLSPEDRGIIYVFNVPEAGSTETSLPKNTTLNQNLLNSGLADSKISDLHYFESLLYIMHDNARVIRAWNITSGQLLATTTLPRVGGGNDDQWEGMSFDENTRSSGAMRGTLPQIELHMALDTPPQVWTFNVTQQKDGQGNAIPGSIVFPECAHAV